MSLNSVLFCKLCQRSDAKRDAGLKIPEDVEYVRDIRYGRCIKYHTLDICRPKNRTGKLPVIISIHGGGYVYGSKEVYQFYAASLAQRGFVVINFNYRLAPKYHFPAPLEDLNKVIVWMMAKREDYPVDLNNVFLVGDSAGAQLASQYGVIYSNKEYRKIMGFRKPKIGIRALGLGCGLYDLKKNFEGNAGRGLIKDYLTSKPSKFGEKLDILEHIDENYPPVYIFSAKGDFLLDKCEPMAEYLRSKGVECECEIFGTEETGHVFHVNMRDEYSAEANTKLTDFFKNKIK